jgi:cytochrome c5
MTKNNTNFGTALIALSIIFFIIFGTYAGFNSLITNSYDTHPNTLAQRLKPIGLVYQVGDIDITKVVSAPKSSKKARSGKTIYSASCQACHATGVAGAPKFGNKTVWKARIALGLDALMKTAINGKGAMPPRGTCGDCSDKELKNAVEYMISKSK